METDFLGFVVSGACRLSAMESITELILKLQRFGIDLFEQRRHREEIARRGREAIRELLPLIPSDPPLLEGVLLETLRGIAEPAERERARDDLEHQLAPNNDPSARKICIRLLAERYPDATHVGQRLIDFATNHAHESKDIRLCALDAVAKLRPTSALGERLVALLRDPDMELVPRALEILRRYPGLAPADVAVKELELLASPTSRPDASMAVRCAAIELLGQFGEVDILERVVLLPLTDERENEAVGKLLRHLLRKPRSLIHLTPKSFEHLVRRLLERMGYEDVQVQQKGSWDEGVDVVAFFHDENRVKGPERVKVIVQCKRYRRASLVSADVVDTMTAALQKQEAARGLIITTSRFMPATLERAQKHRHIELIDGSALQALLDRYFQENLYRVEG